MWPRQWLRLTSKLWLYHKLSLLPYFAVRFSLPEGFFFFLWVRFFFLWVLFCSCRSFFSSCGFEPVIILGLKAGLKILYVCTYMGSSNKKQRNITFYDEPNQYVVPTVCLYCIAYLLLLFPHAAQEVRVSACVHSTRFIPSLLLLLLFLLLLLIWIEF